MPNIERTPPTPLTDAQIVKFLERIKDHKKKDIFILAFLTGLRESEIAELTANCFNKVEHPLKVYRQCVYIGSTRECAELFADSQKISVIGGISPLIDFDAQLALCRKLLTEKLIVGLKIYTGHEKFFCTDTRLEPVYDLAEEYSVPVLFHTGWDDCQYAAPNVMRELALNRKRNIFVYCHCFYPELDECFDKLLGCGNVYFDISSVADNGDIIPKVKSSLEKAIRTAPERFVFGSDFGSCSQKAHLEFADSLDISNVQRELLMYENAKMLYDL